MPSERDKASGVDHADMVKKISCQINATYLVCVVVLTVASLIGFLATREAGYLLFLAIFAVVVLLTWLCARWYILSGRDVDTVVKRRNLFLGIKEER